MKLFFRRVSAHLFFGALIIPAGWAQPVEFPAAPDDSLLWAIGTAWSQDKSTILYQEYHFAENPELDLPTRVQYRNPDGSLIAEKSVDYSVSMTAPAITQIDYRNPSRVNTEFLPAEPSPQVRVGFQAHDSNQYREETVAYRDAMVIDAGFDSFVRANWERITSGRAVSAHFLVPSRFDTVRVNLTQTQSRNCTGVEADIQCFVIRPAGVLRVVGFLIDPIYIGYEQDSQRLMMFNGLSNLRDDAGDPRNVLITYEYF
ncbi:MAG: hypothetical protein Q7W55_13445 [Pseudohongiella sp.]|nr:hypothetical protein [Pseudohongiella sp.]MDP2128860.1 hypothetical protein [Pseudohongiella sp.]